MLCVFEPSWLTNMLLNFKITRRVNKISLSRKDSGSAIQKLVKKF